MKKNLYFFKIKSVATTMKRVYQFIHYVCENQWNQSDKRAEKLRKKSQFIYFFILFFSTREAQNENKSLHLKWNQTKCCLHVVTLMNTDLFVFFFSMNHIWSGKRRREKEREKNINEHFRTNRNLPIWTGAFRVNSSPSVFTSVQQAGGGWECVGGVGGVGGSVGRVGGVGVCGGVGTVWGHCKREAFAPWVNRR